MYALEDSLGVDCSLTLWFIWLNYVYDNKLWPGSVWPRSYMVNTSLDGRFLARSACYKEHRCKISHLRRMEHSKCRLRKAQPFTCCTVEQGWDKHINIYRIYWWICINSFFSLAKSLNSDQARNSVQHDLDPKCVWHSVFLFDFLSFCKQFWRQIRPDGTDMDLNCLTLMIFWLKEKKYNHAEKYEQLIPESKRLFFTVEKPNMHNILAPDLSYCVQ